MYPSNVRMKIRENALILGTAMFTREAHVAASIYQTGADWVWIDQEHSPWGTESVGTIAVQGRQAGCAPVIRVAWNDPGLIKKAYDVGAVGVMVPQVDGPEAAARAIDYAKYPPIGNRGIAPWFAAMMGIDAKKTMIRVLKTDLASTGRLVTPRAATRGGLGGRYPNRMRNGHRQEKHSTGFGGGPSTARSCRSRPDGHGVQPGHTL